MLAMTIVGTLYLAFLVWAFRGIWKSQHDPRTATGEWREVFKGVGIFILMVIGSLGIMSSLPVSLRGWFLFCSAVIMGIGAIISAGSEKHWITWPLGLLALGSLVVIATF